MYLHKNENQTWHSILENIIFGLQRVWWFAMEANGFELNHLFTNYEQKVYLFKCHVNHNPHKSLKIL